MVAGCLDARPRSADAPRAEGAPRPEGPSSPEPPPEPGAPPSPRPTTSPPRRPEPKPSCADDGLEENDTAGAATPLVPGPVQGLRICPGDDDWFAFEATDRASVLVRVRFSHATGDLDATLFRPDGRVLVEAVSQSDDEVLRGSDLTAGLHLLRVGGYAGGGNRYALNLAVAPHPTAPDPPPDPEPEPPPEAEPTPTPPTPVEGRGRLLGRVRFMDRPYDAEGFLDPVPAAARGVEVEVVDAEDGSVLAHGPTDDEGSYDLTFEVDGDAGARQVYLRALALRATPDGRVEVRVPRTGALHAVRSPGDLDVGAGDVAVVNVLASEEDGGGAFNAVDVVATGYDLRRRILGEALGGALTVEWLPGRAFPCSSCYVAGVISLGGRDDDPDEYDDSVIAHEFAHFVADLNGRDDSPGGYHDGTPAWPPLAWSEGYATFFGQWALADRVYFDSFEWGVGVDDVEVFDTPDAFGTLDGAPTGWVSESLVTAILWDLADGGAGEAADAVAQGDRALDPLFGYLPSGLFEDRGAEGADLVDYLDGWFCHGLDQEGGVRALTDHRRFPYDFDWPGDPGRCEGPSKRRPPLDIEARRGKDDVRVVVHTRRAGRLSVVVATAGQGPLDLGTVAAGQRVEARLPLPTDPGPLRGGATLVIGPTQRWHAPIRRPPDAGEAPLPPGARIVVSARGDLLEWAGRTLRP